MPVSSRRLSCKFLKLPHEKQITFITTEIYDFPNPHSTGSQIVFGKIESGGDDILLAGAVKKVFI